MSDYKNSYNKIHYDRINLMVPAGKKDEIRRLAVAKKMSVNEYIWSAITKDMHNAESLNTINIANRRYVGSKQSLIPFIKNSLKNISFHSIADLFAGTGAVADAFNKKCMVITNDILYCNYICHYAWFSTKNYDEKKIRELLIQYNSINTSEDNYVTENYADRYFSYENASKIGYIRENIEQLRNSKTVNPREYALLIMSLLYATQTADVSRTVGHFMTFIKKPKKDGRLQLCLPLAPSPETNRGNQCYHMDALELIKIMPPVDLLYIDPPYLRQYGEYYHVLESIALWQQSPTYGDTKRIKTPKSDFSIKNKAFQSMAELIHQSKNKVKYILLSDNNDPRNHLQNIDVMQILSIYGKTRVFSQDYPTFSGRNKKCVENKERLFLCRIK